MSPEQASRVHTWLGVGALLLGCSGETTTPGLEQPFHVLDAQFVEGALPGLPPLTSDELNAGVLPTQPSITAATLSNRRIPLGEPGRSISGRASPDAFAVALGLADQPSGYWLVPTTSVDFLNNGEIEWRARAAFGKNIETGPHRLLLAAVDGSGHSGSRDVLNLCLLPEVPDDGNACDPTISPPALVISLDWDSPVDLDLRVVTPEGKVVDAKHPTTAVEDENGDLDLEAEGLGGIDDDAGANCAGAARRRENLVFQTTPASGTYLVYANLFDSCGQPDVNFNVSMHVAGPGSEADTYAPQETYRQAGQLLAAHENGGSKLGMFVTSFVAN